MNVTTVRQIICFGGLQVDTQTYGSTGIDFAAMQAGNDMVEHCPGITRTTGTVALVGSARTVDCGSISQFSAENVVRVTVIDYDGIERPVDIVDYDTIISDIAAQGTTVGTAVPTRIAWDSGSIGLVNYHPGTAASRVTVYHDPPFTTWTPGDAASGTIPINIPDRYAYPVFHDGAASIVQYNDAIARGQSLGWQRYVEHRTFIAGRVGNDRGVLIADPNAYL